MRIVISLCLFLSYHLIVAQQYNFISYTQEQGLAHSQVKAIYQDSHGYMWIGTLAGFSRFDGRDFLNYTKIKGLIGTQVNDFLELHDGRLLIGGKGGISFYHNGFFEGANFEGKFSKSLVNDMVEMDDGELWIITTAGLVIYRGGKFTYHLIEKLSNSMRMLALADHEVLFNNRQYLIKYDGLNMDTLYRFDDEVTDFCFDMEKNLWLATDGGLQYLVKNEKGEYKIKETKKPNIPFMAVLLSSKNELWAMNGSEGCYVIHQDTTIVIGSNNGLSSKRIDALFEDTEGNIWLGTDGSGLLKFTSTNIATFTEKDGLSSNLVMSFTEDNEHVIWVATYDGGVNTIIDNRASPFKMGISVKGSKIWNNLVDSQGNIWFGMNNGLVKKTGNNFVFYGKNQLISHRILTLFEDNNQSIWVGTRSGVNYIKNDSIYSLNLPDSINLVKTRVIKQDEDGNYWFGALYGVFKFDGQQFHRYTEANGLSDNSVFDLEFDTHQNLWVGTTSGLSLMKNGKAEVIKIDDNALSERINFLHMQAPYLLAGTNNGVYVLNLDDYYASGSPKFLHLGIEDGLASLEMNQNAVFTDFDKNIWVGSTKGASRIKSLDEIYKRGGTIPKILITKVKLDLQDVDWSKYNSPVDLYTGLPTQLVVGHEQNHFTFEYTGLSFSYPKNIKYQYMLEGFDQDWQPVTTLQFATYSNLDDNHYTFRVRSQNKSGIWSEPTEFSFVITPPFWLTWWFILLSALVFFGLTKFVNNRRKKTLVAKYQSQLLELEQQSLNSSMNRHFIFNSLNSIQYYINSQDRLSANKYLTSFAQLIRKNLDSSQTNHTSLADEIERLKLYLELENMRFKDKFEYEITIDPTIDQESVKVPAMLLQPFLENSIWHGLLPQETKGKLEVTIKQDQDQVIIVIKDNGIGIDESMERKSKSSEKTHDSKGMKITKNRLDLLRKMTNSTMEIIGPYQVTNSKNETKGTEVRIILTISYEKKY